MGKEHPFIFYHAAVALQRAVEHLGAECREELRSAIEKADATMHAFEGVPDVNTVNALTWAAEDLSALEEKK
jgi:hypothetical protein